MPVRSLNSRVFIWPEAGKVRQAASRWCRETLSSHPEIIRIGYRGSYARGDEGVGSDLDLVVVMKRCSIPFERRNLLLDTVSLPVPADLVVFTEEEFDGLLDRRDRFAEELLRHTVWFP